MVGTMVIGRMVVMIRSDDGCAGSRGGSNRCPSIVLTGRDELCDEECFDMVERR